MLSLPPIFSSNMVFAANKPIRIYGKGENLITITFAGITQTVQSHQGKWIAAFPKMSYSGPFTLRVTDGNQAFVFENIFIGTVYLVAGQSNVQFKIGDSDTDPNEYQTNPKLRLFSCDRLEEGEKYCAADGWQCCIAEDVPNWSAIGYLVGKKTAEQNQNSVGIIACYQGASVIESWVPKGCFEKCGIHLLDKDKFTDHHVPLFSAWNQDGKLYEYSLSQVFPFSVSAVVWYQGESDTSEAEGAVYKQELSELIRVWRCAFDDPSLFFAIVQIADFDGRKTKAWQMIQQAQYEIQFEVEHVKTIISRDISQSDDIHPKNKAALSDRIVKALSERLSL